MSSKINSGYDFFPQNLFKISKTACIYLFKFKTKNNRKHVIKSKDTRTRSMTYFWCLYCNVYADFIHSASFNLVDFEQVNDGSGSEVLPTGGMRDLVSG